MKYYDEEILAIAASGTIKAVKESGIYECGAERRSQKQTLFISFKGRRGEMDMLYKLTKKYIIDINDWDTIQKIDTESLPGFFERMKVYRKHVPNAKGVKNVYVLDLNNPIKLPHIVRPAENNSSPAVYYTLNEFFGEVNCRTKNGEYVIVQKAVQIKNGNELNISINKRGSKTYDVYCTTNNTHVKRFESSDSAPLDTDLEYEIRVSGENKDVSLQTIQLTHQKR